MLQGGLSQVSQGHEGSRFLLHFRFGIGFWHADFDEAAPARMWLAQNGAQASGNTDEVPREQREGH